MLLSASGGLSLLCRESGMVTDAQLISFGKAARSLCRDPRCPDTFKQQLQEALLYRLPTVHTQSAAQYGSLAGLAVNDSVIARRFYSDQFDFQERDTVGLDTVQPLS